MGLFGFGKKTEKVQNAPFAPQAEVSKHVRKGLGVCPQFRFHQFQRSTKLTQAFTPSFSLQKAAHAETRRRQKDRKCACRPYHGKVCTANCL